ncbi:hypothetical protein CFC21_095392 [Triticum aestivum]|uniref:Uncharacterized protein n=2 Tax=Triticum aestivum TaxID=4565 RepID=A0A9R1LQ19_WHEAT|nr:uncharacterized protein LOC119331020 [Triticum dicoccoides]XP_044426800.1 uncharacterized protein LOC123151082 [Triticum aestivum]KAF7092945.1 hypothetical protein CFC21_095388 [Triticum aestivum]KAF7092948.1 hypothetical protein CFC21_095392 [Triticum aestivum]
MAARALTAAGRRVAGQSQTRPTPFLASSRSGASMNHSSASAQREDERGDAHGPAAEAMTGAQVEAALNRKNVEVLQGEEEQVATVLPDETIGEGALDSGEDASWVPDQDTGVFVPADDGHGGGAHPAPPQHLYGGVGGSASVLDQAVFVREEMEDVERPAMDLTHANGGSNN